MLVMVQIKVVVILATLALMLLLSLKYIHTYLFEYLNASRKGILLLIFRSHHKAVVAKTTNSLHSTNCPMCPHHQTHAQKLAGYPLPVGKNLTHLLIRSGNYCPRNRNIRLGLRFEPRMNPMEYPIQRARNKGQLGRTQMHGVELGRG